MITGLKTVNGIEIDAKVLACVKAIIAMVAYAFDNAVPTAKGKSVRELRMLRTQIKGYMGRPNGCFPLGVLCNLYNPLTVSKAVMVGNGKVYKAVVTNRGGAEIVTPKDLAEAIEEKLGTYRETSPYARMKFWVYDMRDERSAKSGRANNTAEMSKAPDWLSVNAESKTDVLALLA